jgi:folate-dependent phosphoribosylglycinamide formyltransferase PurN
MRTEKVKNAINIAIITSGEEINTINIIDYFEFHLDVNISCIISSEKINNKFNKYKIDLYEEKIWYKEIDQILTQHNIHYIVLTDYTKNIPTNFIKKYMWKIINVHSSLLPKYKELIGDNIHQTVKKSGDKTSGISIYFINQEYNQDVILFQSEIKIHKTETWQEIKSRVNDLKYKYYSKIIEKIIYI